MDGGEAAETAAAALGPSSFMSVFKHADEVDVALMVLGLLGAMGDGMSTPAMLLITSRVTNDFGRGPDQVQDFSARINAVCVLPALLYAPIALLAPSSSSPSTEKLGTACTINLPLVLIRTRGTSSSWRAPPGSWRS